MKNSRSRLFSSDSLLKISYRHWCPHSDLFRDSDHIFKYCRTHPGVGECRSAKSAKLPGAGWLNPGPGEKSRIPRTWNSWGPGERAARIAEGAPGGRRVSRGDPPGRYRAAGAGRESSGGGPRGLPQIAPRSAVDAFFHLDSDTRPSGPRCAQPVLAHSGLQVHTSPISTSVHSQYMSSI